ncbi:hypothetical protein TWF694_005908 [Orbilia ellipsospora]|uniref:Uncharacterized protein n=1 Tax=Orbilia ellipsospora TaxID=2528407 RepID=A0AAV9WS98_9PEZI
MATITPHHHHVRFTLCRHSYRKYVFDPDPEDPARCICSKIDATKHPFEEFVPGQSGIVFHRVFKQRIIRGRCKYCTAESDTSLTVIEDETWLPPWSGESNGSVGWNDDAVENCGPLELDGADEFGKSPLEPPDTVEDKRKDGIGDSDVEVACTSVTYTAAV